MRFNHRLIDWQHFARSFYLHRTRFDPDGNDDLGDHFLPFPKSSLRAASPVSGVQSSKRASPATAGHAETGEMIRRQSSKWRGRRIMSFRFPETVFPGGCSIYMR
jgi:hypothetical protein